MARTKKDKAVLGDAEITTVSTEVVVIDGVESVLVTLSDGTSYSFSL